MEDLNAAAYYMEREQHSLMLAQAAADPAVAAIHYDLAARYAQLTITAAAHEQASSAVDHHLSIPGGSARG
jgi:hypothetical protein